MTVPASLSKWAHPPRSNTPRSSSSGPPGACITPSTETCVVVVSFMVAVPFLAEFVVVRCHRVEDCGEHALLLLGGHRQDAHSRLACHHASDARCAEAISATPAALGRR